MGADLASDSLTALAADLRRRSADDPALTPFADQLDQVDCILARFERVRPCTHAMMAHLGPALDAAAGEPRLLAATRAVAHAVNWYQIYQGEGVDPGLAEGMLAALDFWSAGAVSVAPGGASCNVFSCQLSVLSCQLSRSASGGPAASARRGFFCATGRNCAQLLQLTLVFGVVRGGELRGLQLAYSCPPHARMGKARGAGDCRPPLSFTP